MTATVHAVGLGGSVGTALSLLADFSREWGLRVTAAPQSVYRGLRPWLRALQDKGVTLVADGPLAAELRELGVEATAGAAAAAERADVVLDGTGAPQPPAGGAGKTRGSVLLGRRPGEGSAWFAQDVNQRALRKGKDRVLHVAPAAVQGMAHVVLALAGQQGSGTGAVDQASFVLLRRGPAVDAGVDVVASPLLEQPEDDPTGVLDAFDARALLASAGVTVPVRADAAELNHQLLHALHFRVRPNPGVDVDTVFQRLEAHPRLAFTGTRSANPVTAYARDHGWAGRLLNAVVVPESTLRVEDDGTVAGFAWVPSEGTEVYSAVAGALWLLDPDSVSRRLADLAPYVFTET